MKLPYRFRRLNHAWAYLAGYFWIPCPNCGRMFGGHECRDGHTIWGEWEGKSRKGRCTCPCCPYPDNTTSP